MAVAAHTLVPLRRPREVEVIPPRARGLPCAVVALPLTADPGHHLTDLDLDLDPVLYREHRRGEVELALMIRALPAVARRGPSPHLAVAKHPADAIAVTRGRCLGLSHLRVVGSHPRAANGTRPTPLHLPRVVDAMCQCLAPAHPRSAGTTLEEEACHGRRPVVAKNRGGLGVNCIPHLGNSTWNGYSHRLVLRLYFLGCLIWSRETIMRKGINFENCVFYLAGSFRPHRGNHEQENSNAHCHQCSTKRSMGISSHHHNCSIFSVYTPDLYSIPF